MSSEVSMSYFSYSATQSRYFTGNTVFNWGLKIHLIRLLSESTSIRHEGARGGGGGGGRLERREEKAESYMTLVVVSIQIIASSHYRQSPCLPYVPNIHFHTYLGQFFAVCKSYFAYRILPSFFVLLKGIVLAFRICVLYNFQCSNLFNM